MSEGGGFRKRKRPTNATDPLRAVKDDGWAESDGGESGVEALEELLAWRKLTKRAATTSGIDLDKLNNASPLNGSREGSLGVVEGGAGAAAVKQMDNGMLEGTDGGLKVMSKETNKILKSDSFTGQTNIVDVNKHMMAYVEEQMRRKKEENGQDDARGGGGGGTTSDGNEPGAQESRYSLAKLPGSEGNVTSSAGMLTSIPEVDLGIDSKLRNIQETEKARRGLLDKDPSIATGSSNGGSSRRQEREEDVLPADRFYKHRTAQESDTDALARARRAALKDEEERQAAKRMKPAAHARREVATDDQVVDRFKKRMMGKR